MAELTILKREAVVGAFCKVLTSIEVIGHIRLTQPWKLIWVFRHAFRKDIQQGFPITFTNFHQTFLDMANVHGSVRNTREKKQARPLSHDTILLMAEIRHSPVEVGS